MKVVEPIVLTEEQFAQFVGLFDGAASPEKLREVLEQTEFSDLEIETPKFATFIEAIEGYKQHKDCLSCRAYMRQLIALVSNLEEATMACYIMSCPLLEEENKLAVRKMAEFI